MAASTSTASATWPNAPSVKKKRRRSSTNLKNPRKRSRKTRSPMPPCPSCKSPPKRKQERKSRKKRSPKKNPARLNQAVSTRRRPFCPGVSCEDVIRHSAYWTDVHRGLRPVWFGMRAIAAFHYLRSDSCENLYARWERHRRWHAGHSRWKNRGRWRGH